MGLERRQGLRLTLGKASGLGNLTSWDKIPQKILTAPLFFKEPYERKMRREKAAMHCDQATPAPVSASSCPCPVV